MNPRDPYARELFTLCQSLTKIAILSHRRMDVTEPTLNDYCPDCGAELPGDFDAELLCDRCLEARDLTAKALSGGDA